LNICCNVFILHCLLTVIFQFCYGVFRLNVCDNNDDVPAYVTYLTLIMTQMSMLHFTRHYIDILQEMLLSLMLSCGKFSKVYVC